jgi:hypothetical protein
MILAMVVFLLSGSGSASGGPTGDARDGQRRVTRRFIGID